MTATANAEVNSNLEPVKQDPGNMLDMQLKDGHVLIQMFPDKAPNHVARIKELTRAHYYDGKLFHRVIDGFMAQTGSPNGDGIGGSSLPNLKAEFNDIHHARGIVSMARTGDPDSANAQFFIMLADGGFLDGQYTAWGKVVSGMEYVDNIKKGDSSDNGTVTNPDKIVKMTVVADEQKAK
jgi:peptidylprolyl isomerase